MGSETKKRTSNEDSPLRESMHGKQHRGRDYSPLFHFLLSKIGQRWDAVFSETVRRLDQTDPIFWMVAKHEHQQRDIVCCGDLSFYSGLFIDEQGLLQQVNPQVTAEDLPVTCLVARIRLSAYRCHGEGLRCFKYLE